METSSHTQTHHTMHKPFDPLQVKAIARQKKNTEWDIQRNDDMNRVKTVLAKNNKQVKKTL
jgi:hypothetical protein